MGTFNFNEPVSVDSSGLSGKNPTSTPQTDGKDLEMILEKSWRHSPMLSRDFSVAAYKQLMGDSLTAVEKAWGGYHADEFDNRQSANFEGGKLRMIETHGSRGFYASAEYLPPDAGAGRARAQIKLKVPLNEKVEDLESSQSVPLREVAEALATKGYKPATSYKT